MNSIIEKEKKLNSVLEKLKNLNLKNPELDKNIEELKKKKESIRNWKKRSWGKIQYFERRLWVFI